MQIQLTEDELEVAVRDYIKKMGISRPVGDIKFTATRGENAGISTTVEVEEELPAKPIISTNKRAIALQVAAVEPVNLDSVVPEVGDIKSTATSVEEANSDNSIFG